MFNSFFDIVVFIVIVALVGLSVFAYVRKIFLSLKERKTAKRELELPIKKPTTLKVQATVLSKRADTVYEGSPLYPKHKLKFFATFKMSGDKTLEYEISKNLFECLQMGQNGTLITANGKFFNFDIG